MAKLFTIGRSVSQCGDNSSCMMLKILSFHNISKGLVHDHVSGCSLLVVKQHITNNE